MMREMSVAHRETRTAARIGKTHRKNFVDGTYSYASINWFRFKGFDLRPSLLHGYDSHPLGRAAP